MPARQAISEAQRIARSANLRAGSQARVDALRDAIVQRVDAGKKRCSVCSSILLLDAFGEDRSHADGRRSACRDCANERRRELAAQARRVAASTVFPGWVVKACGCPLLDDGRWWWVPHKAACGKRPFQVDTPGDDGRWEVFCGRPARRLRSRGPRLPRPSDGLSGPLRPGSRAGKAASSGGAAARSR